MPASGLKLRDTIGRAEGVGGLGKHCGAYAVGDVPRGSSNGGGIAVAEPAFVGLGKSLYPWDSASTTANTTNYATSAATASDGGALRSHTSNSLRAEVAGTDPQSWSAKAIGKDLSPRSPFSRRTCLREPCAMGEGLGGSNSGPPLKPPSVWAGSTTGVATAATAPPHSVVARSSPLAATAAPNEAPSSDPRGSDPRVDSFARLNGFLLRTHITSLISALAEDGWLKAWEKERLCRSAREDSSEWATAFLRNYVRLMETNDVHTFVAALRAQTT